MVMMFSSQRQKTWLATVQSSVESRLALSSEKRAVVTFDYDVSKGTIASPIRRDYPKFVGGGLTKGGAREWVIPNVPLKEMPICKIAVRHLKDLRR